MREASIPERVAQAAIALILTLPLLLAFKGSGGFSDAYGAWQPVDAAAQDARQWALVLAGLRSLAIGILTVLLALLIGIPSGWALARQRRPLLLLVIMALPLALPASVSVSGWIKLLAPNSASAFAMPFTAAKSGLPGWLFSITGASVVLASGLWPIIAFESWPAFKQARNDAFDAALLYSSSRRAFFRIVLPQARGEISAGAMLVFLLAVSDFNVSSLLLVRTLPTEIHDALINGKSASAAWASLPILFMAAALAWMLSRLAAKLRDVTSGPFTVYADHPRWALLGLAIGLAFGFLIPMGACLAGAFSGGQAMSRIYGLGSDSVATTLRLAGAAAVMALLVGLARLVAWPDSRARALDAVGLFFLAIPGSFLAAGLLTLQSDLLWAGRIAGAEDLSTVMPAAILGIGYTLRFVYLPLRLVEEGLGALDPDLLDVAALAGHGRISRAVSIALPLVLPHLAAASALVFILSLGEIPIADKLHSPGVTPATIWLFQQQHLGYDETVFGLSLLLGALASGTLLAAGLAATVLDHMFRRTT